MAYPNRRRSVVSTTPRPRHSQRKDTPVRVTCESCPACPDYPDGQSSMRGAEGPIAEPFNMDLLSVWDTDGDYPR
jgi:hypothetical protein